MMSTAMDTNVMIAFIGAIVAITSTVTPIIVLMIQNASRKAEKLEDIKRQEVVASKVDEAARLVAEEAGKRAIFELSRQAAAKALDTKVDGVHQLVNNNYSKIATALAVALEKIDGLVSKNADLEKRAAVREAGRKEDASGAGGVVQGAVRDATSAAVQGAAEGAAEGLTKVHEAATDAAVGLEKVTKSLTPGPDDDLLGPERVES